MRQFLINLFRPIHSSRLSLSLSQESATDLGNPPPPAKLARANLFKTYKGRTNSKKKTKKNTCFGLGGWLGQLKGGGGNFARMGGGPTLQGEDGSHNLKLCKHFIFCFYFKGLPYCQLPRRAVGIAAVVVPRAPHIPPQLIGS